MRHLIMDLAASASLVLIPRRFCWSSRSTRLLTGSGVALAVSSLSEHVSPLGGRSPIRVLSFGGEVVIGLTLIVAQYLLTEEESRVRGAIAGMGGSIVLLALLRRLSDGVSGMQGAE